MCPTNLTTDDLKTGDTLRNTTTGEHYTVQYTRPNGNIKFERYDDDELTGWSEIAPADLTEQLSSGEYEPHDVEALKTPLADLYTPVAPGTDVYIRFGDIPEGERSTNNIDGSKEEGVSVYAAELDRAPEDVDADVMYVPVGSKVQQVLLLLSRTTYLVTGDEVGTGVDGEPVLRNVEIATELTSPKGCAGFTPKGAN